MLSEKHREKFSINLLHKTYEPNSIVNDLITFLNLMKLVLKMKQIQFDWDLKKMNDIYL